MKIAVGTDLLREDGTLTVSLRVFHKVRRRKLLLRIHPKHWDEKKLRVKISHPQSAHLNRHITSTLERAERLSLEREGITADELIRLLSSPDGSGKSFSEIALLDLKETPPRSWHTQRNRKAIIHRFSQFRIIPTASITPFVMEQFRAYLLCTPSHPGARIITENSAVNYLRVIRTMYRRVCKRLGIVPRNILEDVDATEHYSEVPQMVSPQEVQRLERYADSRTGWKAQGVHMWLFSYYSSGIRWGDLCRLTTGQIGGGRVVIPAQGKNKAPKNVVLRPQAARIASLYTVGDYVFGINADKVPTEQQIKNANLNANRSLRAAAKACGIALRMHTHNSRHTYMAQGLKHRVDDRILQRSMGIGDKAFKHYRAQFPQSDIDEANDLIFEDG